MKKACGLYAAGGGKTVLSEVRKIHEHRACGLHVGAKHGVEKHGVLFAAGFEYPSVILDGTGLPVGDGVELTDIPVHVGM